MGDTQLKYDVLAQLYREGAQTPLQVALAVSPGNNEGVLATLEHLVGRDFVQKKPITDVLPGCKGFGYENDPLLSHLYRPQRRPLNFISYVIGLIRG